MTRACFDSYGSQTGNGPTPPRLKRISPEIDNPTWEYLREVSSVQGAAIQLTLESMHLFNSAVADRPGVQYSCMITAAAPPPHAFQRSDFLSPHKAVAMLAFWVLYAMSSRASKAYPYTAMEPSELNLNKFSAPFEITPSSNDGIVPCQSQGYGKVLDIVLGDHLDIVGQFYGADGEPYADWLPCGANFGEAEFRNAWARIADEIAATEAQGAPRPTSVESSPRRPKPRPADAASKQHQRQVARPRKRIRSPPTDLQPPGSLGGDERSQTRLSIPRLAVPPCSCRAPQPIGIGYVYIQTQ